VYGVRAAIAVAEIGATPGMVISLRDTSSSRARRVISLGFGLLQGLPEGRRWIMDAIALRRGGRKGIAEEHHARHRPTNAVSPGRAKVSISRLLITDSA
jgi:hypothetical protein